MQCSDATLYEQQTTFLIVFPYFPFTTRSKDFGAFRSWSYLFIGQLYRKMFPKNFDLLDTKSFMIMMDPRRTFHWSFSKPIEPISRNKIMKTYDKQHGENFYYAVNNFSISN